MHRRHFIGSCSAAVCVTALPALAANARPHPYARALLADARGDPLRAAAIEPLTNYVFHYPYHATPVFLLDLAQPLPAQSLLTSRHDAYAWPGGVGPNRSIVAYSAICAHRLVYPTRDVSFISFRKKRARRGVQDRLIHCCSEHSQYDPARGAQVVAGPATQPLCAVLLEYDAHADTLTAYATLGGELFEAFFRQYRAKLAIEEGAGASDAVAGRTVVQPLTQFCRNPIQC
jgi:arsenite oxidase small subunit